MLNTFCSSAYFQIARSCHNTLRGEHFPALSTISQLPPQQRTSAPDPLDTLSSEQRLYLLASNIGTPSPAFEYARRLQQKALRDSFCKTRKRSPSICHSRASSSRQPRLNHTLSTLQSSCSNDASPSIPASLERKHGSDERNIDVTRYLWKEGGRLFSAEHKSRRRALA